MKKRGFTLIEMLIVIVIIGILAGALIPRIGNARDKANDVSIQANVNALAAAGMQAIIDGNGDDLCGATNDINYTNLGVYGMADLEPGADTRHYKCRVVLDDHIIVWNDNMNVDTNNNCATAATTGAVANLEALMAIPGGGSDVYCLAQ